MLKPSRSLISGRAAVVTLSVAAAMIAGGVLFTSSARAQASTGSVGRADFGPIKLEVIGANGGDSSHALIGLLLPAVQRPQQPFTIEVLNDDTDLVAPALSGNGRTSCFFDVFLEIDSATGAMMLHVNNLTTGQNYAQATGFSNVTVRALPAVQSNGNVVSPLASSAVVKGSVAVTMGDGSVVPMPVEYNVPHGLNEQGR